MKIFCISIYNENYSYFKKNNLIPVGLGKNYFDESWLNDKFKDDISFKNENFGEYSFHYKLWKDLLLKSENDEWIGFCTYRRFWVKKNSLLPKNLDELSNIVLKETPKEWDNYDCILADPVILGKWKFMKLIKNNFELILKKPSLLINKCTIRDNFNINHGSYFLDEAIKLLNIDERYKFQNYLEKYEFNPHNIFICKNTLLLKSFYNKIFEWLFKCENIFSKFNLDTYGKKRIYGFLAERYLPFWFQQNCKTLNWPYVFFDTNKYNGELKKFTLSNT